MTALEPIAGKGRMPWATYLQAIAPDLSPEQARVAADYLRRRGALVGGAVDPDQAARAIAALFPHRRSLTIATRPQPQRSERSLDELLAIDDHDLAEPPLNDAEHQTLQRWITMQRIRRRQHGRSP